MRNIFYYILIAIIAFAGIFFNINQRSALICIFSLAFVNAIYTIFHIMNLIKKYKKSKALQGFDIADPKMFDSITRCLHCKLQANIKFIIDIAHKNEDGSLTINAGDYEVLKHMYNEDYWDLTKAEIKSLEQNTTVFIDSVLFDYNNSH